MFAIELVLPFFLFGPRRARLLAVGGIATLQLLIALTGNYGFFNLLTLVLCLMCVDDAVWRQVTSSKRQLHRERVHPARFIPRKLVLAGALAIVLLSLVPLAAAFRRPMPYSGRW